jgi:potassium-transporting ATPase KdpC subunit
MRRIGKEITTSAIAVVVFTLVLGLAYPLLVTGTSQLVFHHRANGSQIVVNGRVIGSELIGQPAMRGRKPDPRYFQPRPSATGYSPSATFFSNRGPNQVEARNFYRAQLAAYLKRERPYDQRLTAAAVPVDAVTTSASGVDPHISPANAAIQAHRVAAVRRMPLATVDQLIDAHTDDRSLGILGEPGVNVLELNLALDRAGAA